VTPVKYSDDLYLFSLILSGFSPVAEFIDPDLGDKVNSGIGLSYRLTRLNGMSGRYDNLMPELTLSPGKGSMNSATVS
jgi:hypothetical protein